MKVIKDFGVYSLYCFEKEEYLDDYDKLNKFMYRILASRENIDDNYDEEDAREQIDDINSVFFTKEYLKAKVYFLFNKVDKTPVSFAIYSHDEERGDWHLEYISTHAEYSNMGIGCSLMKLSANDLKSTEWPTITSVVNKKNDASLSMHNSFAGTKGVKISCEELDEDRYTFEFDIKNINLSNDEEMEMSVF